MVRRDDGGQDHGNNVAFIGWGVDNRDRTDRAAILRGSIFRMAILWAGTVRPCVICP